MTATPTAERDAFEKWLIENYLGWNPEDSRYPEDHKFSPGIYRDREVDSAWDGWQARAAISQKESAWLPIESAPTFPDKRSFIVIGYFKDRNYLTDPWSVFRDAENNFVRWPHSSPPTHWQPLPPLPIEE